MKKYKEERPWGNFEQFCHNEQVTVKIINVKPNEQLSLQFHNKRDEFWQIVQGQALIIIGDKVIEGKTDDEFFIPKKTNHRIETKDSSVKILEVSYGHFDENDIVRLEDKYNRNSKNLIN